MPSPKKSRSAKPLANRSPQRTAQILKGLTRLRPTLAIVLGSGFQHVLEELQADTRVPYRRLPGFPSPSVVGHTGELLLGHLGGVPILILSGRAHLYEGHSMETVTFPMRVLAAFGITDVLLTNAAGGIASNLRPGHFMVLSDHINFMGINPLRGAPADSPRFVDLTCTYDPELRRLLRQAGKTLGIRLTEGVYLAVAGPSYETPAEIRAFARFGADAVGMSTVPEAIVARACKIRVCGLSCITNLAAGRTPQELSHREVLETASKVKSLAAGLLLEFAKSYGERQASSGLSRG